MKFYIKIYDLHKENGFIGEKELKDYIKQNKEEILKRIKESGSYFLEKSPIEVRHICYNCSGPKWSWFTYDKWIKADISICLHPQDSDFEIDI